MTFDQLKTQLRKVVGDRLADGAVFSQSDYFGFVLNDVSIPALVEARDWPWKEVVRTATIPAGVYKVEMPPDLHDVRTLILHTGVQGTTRPLEFRYPRAFFDLFPDPALENPTYPSYYTWVDRELWLNCPTADVWALRLVGLIRPPRLENPDDQPAWLDEDKHMLLVFHAAGFIYSVIEDSKNSVIWFRLYDQGVAAWWNRLNDQSDRIPTLGRYSPGGGAERLHTEYWRDANVRWSPNA